MSALAWSDDLCLNHAQMDRTHQEFVDLLGLCRSSLDGGDFPGALTMFERLLEHTVDHFAQEDRWMAATGFSPENCHTRQHEMVLRVMREVIRLAREEDRRDPLGTLVAELTQWFPLHAQMMDAGLAQHMADLGFDTATGVATRPLPEVALTHCGSGGCR